MNTTPCIRTCPQSGAFLGHRFEAGRCRDCGIPRARTGITDRFTGEKYPTALDAARRALRILRSERA